MFGHPGGMHTNGGCQHLKTKDSVDLRRIIRALSGRAHGLRRRGMMKKSLTTRKAVLREHPEVRVPGVWKDLPVSQMYRDASLACGGIRRFMIDRDVSVQVYDVDTKWGPVIHLLIRPHNELPIRSWYKFQQIKDAVVGPDRTAVEVYPTAANMHDEDLAIYHLWVLPEGFDLPFGLTPLGPHATKTTTP